MIKSLERIGVSAVIIEDKIGIKRNSLFEDTSNQLQDRVEEFSRKISEGKKIFGNERIYDCCQNRKFNFV